MFATLPTFVIVPVAVAVKVCPVTSVPLVNVAALFVNAVPSYTFSFEPAVTVIFLFAIVNVASFVPV